MKYPAARILIFAKAPIPGLVKTRLSALLGDEGAARLHAELVARTVARVHAAQLAPIQLWCAPTSDEKFFQTLSQSSAFMCYEQRGADLGARMLHAFQTSLRTATYAIAIGTDWPALTSEILESAIERLVRGDDAVVVPAEDGGYVLLGLRRVDEMLFNNIAWGTDSVMATTRARFTQLSWHWSELPTSWDVDRPDDFMRAVREGLIADPRAARMSSAP